MRIAYQKNCSLKYFMIRYFYMGQKIVDKGGERVIQDTIQAIQDAEAKADAMIKEADKKAEEMIAQAKQEAEEKKEAAVNQAKAAAKQQLDAVFECAREGEAAFESEISKDVEALKAVAKQKEAQAVEAVIAELF